MPPQTRRRKHEGGALVAPWPPSRAASGSEAATALFSSADAAGGTPRRCSGCGRFVRATGPDRCARCLEEAGSTLVATPIIADVDASPLPAPLRSSVTADDVRRQPLSPAEWAAIHERIRADYIIPRPTELHPERVAQPAPGGDIPSTVEAPPSRSPIAATVAAIRSSWQRMADLRRLPGAEAAPIIIVATIAIVIGLLVAMLARPTVP